MLAEQIVIEGLKEEIRALTIQSGAFGLSPFSRSTRSPTTRSADALDLTCSLRAVQRNHKLVRFKHRESKADREFEALEERERLAVAKVRLVRFSHSRTTEALRPDCLLMLSFPFTCTYQLGKVRESSARGLEHQAQAELQALEEQLTRQVEETKRVELALRQRDKDERRAQAALREEVQEREEEILRQVEETKRVEQALRLREKELYSLKVRPARSPLRPPHLTKC